MFQPSIRVLLVEDNPADALLAQESFEESPYSVHLDLVENGEQAMQYLRQEDQYEEAPRPDIMLLDLNLPRKDGRQVLAEIKSDDSLRTIPVIIITSSHDQEDVIQSYHLHANCYITKPVNLKRLQKVIQHFEDFWFSIARLPTT